MLSDWLDELDRLERAATPGEWYCSNRGDGSGSVYQESDEDGDEALLDHEQCPFFRGEVIHEDGQLVVALRNHARQLIEIARAAKDAVAVIEAWQERGLTDLSIDGIADVLSKVLSRPTCAEQWDSLPFSSGHVFQAGIHGEPSGTCQKCGKSWQAYADEMTQKAIALMSRSVPSEVKP